MKKTTLYLGIIAIALTSCNNSKTENAENAVKTEQSSGSSEVDLANRGLDGLEVTVAVPDSLKDKLKFSKGEYTGSLDIAANEKFIMTITSNWASEDDTMAVTLKERMSTIKHNIDPSTTRYLIEEPNAILWEYTTDDGVKAYHFYTQMPGGKSTFYSAEDKQGSVFSEKTVRAMLEIAKSIKQKV